MLEGKKKLIKLLDVLVNKFNEIFLRKMFKTENAGITSLWI